MTPAGFNRAVGPFCSLKSCIDFIRLKYGEGRITVPQRDIYTHETGYGDAPAFLYRGEGRQYPTTTSLMQRLEEDSTISEKVRNTIKRVVNRLDKSIQSSLHLPPQLSEGFLQHYGAPTQTLDATSSLKVAGHFASAKEDDGLLVVIPMNGLASNGICPIDLTIHPAVRPRLQAAYSIPMTRHHDLKSETTSDALDLTWFSFKVTDNDRKLYRDDCLLSVRADAFAGTLQLCMNDIQKFDDAAARWLADRITPCPFFLRGQDGTPVPLREVPYDYDENQERDANYRRWSDQHQ